MFFFKLQQNPFADDEAEEDDDEEAGDGENLKLHWSDDDDDDNDEKEAETKSKKTADEDDEGTLNMIKRVNINFTVFKVICFYNFVNDNICRPGCHVEIFCEEEEATCSADQR